MSKTVLFFDTYAFFEIIRGNPKYAPYKETTFITTIFNLAEFNYALKRETGEILADEYTQKYGKFIVQVLIDDIKKAMSFRLKHRELSISDAIGYIVAQRYNINFLTGDEAFKEFENVEFVKK